MVARHTPNHVSVQTGSRAKNIAYLIVTMPRISLQATVRQQTANAIQRHIISVMQTCSLWCLTFANLPGKQCNLKVVRLVWLEPRRHTASQPANRQPIWCARMRECWSEESEELRARLRQHKRASCEPAVPPQLPCLPASFSSDKNHHNTKETSIALHRLCSRKSDNSNHSNDAHLEGFGVLSETQRWHEPENS